MSFVEQKASVRPASVAAVAAVHAVIGYVVISGLAMQVVRYVDPPLITRQYPADPPPPPPLSDVPPTARTAAPYHPEPMVDVTLPAKSFEISQIAADPLPKLGPAVIDTPLPPARPSLAKGAAILGNRAAWVTTQDYPASAVRAGSQGTTAILATIGADGRVAACRVTASSGDRALDETACRTYGRRARFAPALDEAGKPIVSERADRIRWQLPAE